MKYKISNSINEAIEVGIPDPLNPNSVFKYKTLKKGDTPLEFDYLENREIAILVPEGTQFLLGHGGLFHFEFVQAKPVDTNHPGKDSYLFLVQIGDFNHDANSPIVMLSHTVTGDGDGDVGVPDNRLPLGK